jgi:hypothetical protein
MSADQTSERPSEQRPQPPAKPADGATPPTETPSPRRGFWRNPTEPLEREYQPLHSKREGQ